MAKLHMKTSLNCYISIKQGGRDGLLALESHVSDPHHSSIFQRYPKIVGNHHACDFIAGALRPILDGSVTSDQLEVLLEQEISAGEREHHSQSMCLEKPQMDFLDLESWLLCLASS